MPVFRVVGFGCEEAYREAVNTGLRFDYDHLLALVYNIDRKGEMRLDKKIAEY
jgi:hypothetical protein